MQQEKSKSYHPKKEKSNRHRENMRKKKKNINKFSMRHHKKTHAILISPKGKIYIAHSFLSLTPGKGRRHSSTTVLSPLRIPSPLLFFASGWLNKSIANISPLTPKEGRLGQHCLGFAVVLTSFLPFRSSRSAPPRLTSPRPAGVCREWLFCPRVTMMCLCVFWSSVCVCFCQSVCWK